MRDATGQEKAALREGVLARRDRLPLTERRRRSAAACRRTVALPELADAGVVLCFASFRSEVDTAPIVTWCLDRGKVLAMPRVTADRAMRALRVVDPRADLAPGFCGIPEPRRGCATVAPATIEAAIVPGVAFDPGGGRIGYGGGYYDAYLPRLPAVAVRIAIAFDLQVVKSVPRADHDLPVDVIVTESRVLRARRRR